MSGVSINWENNKVEFGVTSIPNRRSKALYATRGCQIEVLAYFTSDDNAERFQKIIDLIVRIYEGEA